METTKILLNHYKIACVDKKKTCIYMKPYLPLGKVDGVAYRILLVKVRIYLNLSHSLMSEL